MRKEQQVKRNRKLITYARNHPEKSQESIGKTFHIDQSRVSRILKNNTCENCYHKTDKHCCCREDSDIIHNFNKCSDWRYYAEFR
jgi:hypothetical protein